MTIVDSKKVAGFFGDLRTIWLGLGMLIVGAAWAGDLRWLTVADAEMIPIQIKVDALSEDIEELAVKKKYVKDVDKRNEIDDMILYKKEKREALVQKHSIK